jgi:predicted DNA-binding protein
MERTTEQWTISLPPLLSKEAMKLAKLSSRTKSELVREALRRYIKEEADFLAARIQLGKNMRKRGIRTLADIERIIDEGRT